MNKRFQLKYGLFTFKLLLLLWFMYLFQDRVISHDVTYEITRIHYSYLALLIPLIFFNWFLEYRKWKIITEVNQQTDTRTNQNAFFAGIVGSFLTPSIAGNFLGRIWYYPTAIRWRISIQSSLANFSQTLIAICFGILFLVISPRQDNIAVMFWIMITSTLLLVYLFCEQLLIKLPWQKIRLIGTTMLSSKIRLQLLTLSLTRYMLMVAQYCVALLFFGAALNLEYLEPIALVFLFVTITPSLFFGKIIVRESIALTTFSLYALPLNEVFFASLLIWVLSIFFPVLIALTFLKAPKLKFT